MARLIWTEPALDDLEAIAEYIALDDPLAASRLVEKVFDKVERLRTFPKSGKRPRELPRAPYLEVVVSPCRISYRIEHQTVFILHVMRAERLLRQHLLDLRNKDI